jgi:hypothetical protein
MVATIGTRWWLPRAYRTTRTEKGKHMTTTATEKLPAMQRNTTKTTARKPTPTESKIVAALKASPVRTDVTPADVTVPVAETPARKPRARKTARTAEQIAADHAAVSGIPAPVIIPVETAPTESETGIGALETIAHRLLSAAVADAVKLAETLVKLHALKPWDTHKVTMKSYYADVMGIRADNFPFPTDARRHLVKRMHESAPKTPVAEIQAMTGASERTIKNDRAFLRIANENRQAGQPTTGTTRTPAAPAQATAPVPVPAGKMVVSVAVVTDFIASLDDTEILEELGNAITARMTELGFKFDE